uniref:Uncharacterized protein n=1 Tax=Panagrolaimus sp. JU765 TaxID=591449 RepID=A0AC34R8Y8_9BILA
MWHEEDNELVLDCGDEALPFYPARDVHIVPIYALTFLVDLPIRPPGQTFSNWDIREKIKSFVDPHELKDLKVVQSNDHQIKFTAHVLNLDIMDEVITTLDNITFRAPGFESALKVTAKVGGYPFPKPEDWTKYFKGQRLKQDEPGERPDTIHIVGLPYEWFAPNVTDDVTSIMIQVMQQYGKIRQIDIPQEDPYRGEMEKDIAGMKLNWFNGIMQQYGKIRQIDIPQEDPYRGEMEKDIAGMKLNWFNGSYSPFFEIYVQYEKYEGFYNAMTKMGGHQLVRRAASGVLSEYQFTIDFDKTGHLSHRVMIQRELARQVIIQQRKQKQEDEERKARELELMKERLSNESERKALEEKIKAGIRQAEKQRELDEDYLRKRLKDKKRQQTLQRIRESENLLKYLLVDEVIRIEWEKEQERNVQDKIKDYVKTKKLPEENLLRKKLLKKMELELRSGVAKKPMKNELTVPTLTPHQKRRKMLKEMKSRRTKLLKYIDGKLQRYRSKFKEDPVFDRQKLAAPEPQKQISINIKTKNLDEIVK